MSERYIEQEHEDMGYKMVYDTKNGEFLSVGYAAKRLNEIEQLITDAEQGRDYAEYVALKVAAQEGSKAVKDMPPQDRAEMIAEHYCDVAQFICLLLYGIDPTESIWNFINARSSVETIKVSAQSKSTAVAGAVAGTIRDYGKAEVQAIGAGAVNQAIKAIAIARSYLIQDNLDLAVVPTFAEVDIEGEMRTAVRLYVESRATEDAPDVPRSEGRKHEKEPELETA